MSTAVSLSPIFNGVQFFDNEGLPLSGGKIFQYEAGSSSVALATYTTTDGDVANSQPIDLDSSGRMVTDMWLQNGLGYHLVLTMPDGTTILTDVDNVIGVQPTTTSGGGGLTTAIWTASVLPPTYVNSTSFVLADNEMATFAVGNRVQFAQTGGFGYGTITAVSFSSPNTTVTIACDSTVMNSSLTAVYWSVLVVAGRTVDAGAVSYSASTLAYATAGTVGNQLRAIGVTGAALNTAIQSLETVYTTGGTSTAYTLTPSPAATSYAVNQVFRVKFHTANGASPTINVSGVGAIALKQYDPTGAVIAPVITSGMVSQLAYDGTEFIVLDQLPIAAVPAAHGSAVYTSNGTWTCPAGVTSVSVLCVGGGGGGGAGADSGPPDFVSYTGGTGGLGGSSKSTVTVVAGTGYGIAIGAGGAHATSGTNGSAGGNTTFGSSTVTATGGSGGIAATTSANGATGANGTSTVGDYGTTGTAYVISSSPRGGGGAGGYSSLGLGSNGTPGMIALSW